MEPIFGGVLATILLLMLVWTSKSGRAFTRMKLRSKNEGNAFAWIILMLNFALMAIFIFVAASALI